jgi:cysteinyl-tRNA synthetase
MKYLGETFDIHTGGIDHIPVHHNNEIAQSESANGKPLANYWLHNAFVNIAGGKMAKSEGNFIRLQTLIEKDFNPLAYRYLLLTAHYSTPISFTWEALESAQKTLIKLAKDFGAIKDYKEASDQSYIQKFQEYIFDDLDTPKAIALVWELMKDKNIRDSIKKETLREFDKVLGLNLEELSKTFEKAKKIKISKEVSALLKEREKARAEKDWQKSDELRDKILGLGFKITDTDKGQELSEK